MIPFFRKIRKQFADDNKPLKYMRYAIGEIVLVVIGILIALSINNWNENRKSNTREKNLLIELRTNLQTNVKNLNTDIVTQVQSAKIIHLLLEHLDHQKPYTDSLDYYFAEADYAPDVVLTSSAFETLKSIGFDLIKTDSLRKEILYLFEVTYPTLMQETKRIEDQVWPTASVPMYQKHFRREIIGQARPIYYDALLQDKEFTNMLSFRVAMREGSTSKKIQVVNETNKLIQFIENEMIKRKSKNVY
jgi:hypothetical protein